jgi:hypothetical protein
LAGYSEQITCAVVGQLLRTATAKTGRPVLYHPSNLGFKYPRQTREYQAIGAHQWYEKTTFTTSHVENQRNDYFIQAGAGQ